MIPKLSNSTGSVVFETTLNARVKLCLGQETEKILVRKADYSSNRIVGFFVCW